MDDRQAAELHEALAVAGIASRPIAVLDLDAVDANLRDLRRRAAGKQIRVASKSLRVRRLLEYVLAQEGFAGTLAYTLHEALWLVEHGFRDVVVAYPTADRDAIRRLSADPRSRDQITLMIDSVEQLDFIDAVAPKDAEIRVAVELDAAYAPVRGVRFGALRSPIRTAPGIAELAREVHQRDGYRLVGFMAYEGQIAGVADAGGSAYRRAVRQMKARSSREIALRRAAAVEAVRAVAEIEFVNGGGTGSLETTTAEPAVTEVAVGSGIVGPGLFDGYRSFRPDPALHFGLHVVRRPAPAVATLLGGGWVASGPPGHDRLPTIAWPKGLKYAPDEGPGEVQTPVVGRAAGNLRVGDTVWLRHAKAGELAERVASYVVVRRVDGKLSVVDEWATYRGEGLATL